MERGHVKKRQKSSKSVKKFFDTFRQFSRRAKNDKNRQKVSNSFSKLFDNFRATPFFRPLLGGSGIVGRGPWALVVRVPGVSLRLKDPNLLKASRLGVGWLLLRPLSPSFSGNLKGGCASAHLNRSDLRLRCPSRPPEIARLPRQDKAMLHCDLRVRWKVASDLRFQAAISEPKIPSFCRISGDLAP